MSSRSDNFNRADSTTALGTPSDGGSAWVAASGVFGIASNNAYKVSTNGSYEACYLEASTSNVDVQTTLTTLGSGGLCARVQNNSNFLFFQVSGTSTGQLWKRVGGSFTALGTTYSGAFAAGDVLKLTVDAANSIKCYKNGTLIISVTDAAGSTNTKHGLLGHTTVTTYDDFSITDAAGGSVALTVSGLTSAPTLASPAIVQTHALSAAGLASSPTIDALAIMQAHQMAVAGLSSAPTLAALAITQTHTLAVAGLSSTPSLAALAIAQTYQLAVSGLSSTPSLASVTLPGGSVFNLAVSGLSSTPTLGTPTITQVHALQVAGGVSAPTLAALAISQTHQLAVAGLVSTPTLGSVTLGAGPSYNLAASGLTSTPALAALAIAQAYQLAITGLNSAPTLGQVAIGYVGPGGISLQASVSRQVIYPRRLRGVDCFPL